MVDPDCVFAFQESSEECQSTVHVEFGRLLPGQVESRSILTCIKARSGVRSLSPTAYVKLSSASTVSMSRISAFEFDLSDLRLLARRFDDIAMKAEAPFSFTSSLEYAPIWRSNDNSLEKIVPFVRDRLKPSTQFWAIRGTLRVNGNQSIYVKSVELKSDENVMYPCWI